MPIPPHFKPLSFWKGGKVRGLLFLLFFFYAGLSHAEPSIMVQDAWCRPTMGKMKMTAIYLTLANNSKENDVLLGISIPIAKQSSLHNTLTRKDGVMQMFELDNLSLPAGKTLKFVPGGLHIMVSGLTIPLKEGDHFPITLKFRNAGKLEGIVNVE